MFLVTIDFEHTYTKNWCLQMSIRLVKLAVKYCLM